MHNNLKAIAFAVGAAFSTSIMDASAKALVANHDVMPLLALRGMVIVAVMLTYGLWRYGKSSFRVTRPGYQLLRIYTILATSIFFFLALRTLPFTDVTVIFFSGAFFMVLLSWPILGERIPGHRFLVVLIGFGGVAIVVQPEWGSLEIGAIFAVSAAVCYALTLLISRKVSGTETTFSMVFYGNLGVMVFALPFITETTFVMSVSDWILVAAMGLSAISAHSCIVHAFSLADAGTVAPFEYTGAIWAVLIGLLFFEEIPGLHVIVGATIIIAAGLYVVMKEKSGRRQDRSQFRRSNRTA